MMLPPPHRSWPGETCRTKSRAAQHEKAKRVVPERRLQRGANADGTSGVRVIGRPTAGPPVAATGCRRRARRLGLAGSTPEPVGQDDHARQEAPRCELKCTRRARRRSLSRRPRSPDCRLPTTAWWARSLSTMAVPTPLGPRSTALCSGLDEAECGELLDGASVDPSLPGPIEVRHRLDGRLARASLFSAETRLRKSYACPAHMPRLLHRRAIVGPVPPRGRSWPALAGER
jgi:hypothetical protein